MGRKHSGDGGTRAHHDSWSPLATVAPLSLVVAVLPLWSIAWASPSLQTPPTSISVTVDRGAEGTYAEGDPIVACVQAQTSPAFPDYAPSVRVTNVQANGVSSVLYEGQVQGQRCINGFATPPPGRETIRADYLVVGITGQPQVVNTAQVSFRVVARTAPPPLPAPAPPPPAQTSAPPTTPSQPPAPTRTAAPTEAPTPTMVPPVSENRVPPGPFSVALIGAICGGNGHAEASLAWSLSEHFDFYDVYRDDQLIWSEGPKSSFGYVDSEAPTGAEIGYRVVASNPVGTQSADPVVLWVQTPVCDEPTDDPS